MFRRIVSSSGLAPALVAGVLGAQKNSLFCNPTPARLNNDVETDSDEFDVFDDDSMWFMEELLSEGGEMDFVIPSEDARMLQGEKQ